MDWLITQLSELYINHSWTHNCDWERKMIQLPAVVSLSFQSVQSVLQPQISLLLFNTSLFLVVLKGVRHFLTSDFKEAVIRLTFCFRLWRRTPEMHEILARTFSDNDGGSAEFRKLFFPLQVLEKFGWRLCPCISSLHGLHRRKRGTNLAKSSIRP